MAGPKAQTTEQQMQCFQLEQELQQVSQGGGTQRAQLAKIEADIRKFDRIYQQGQAQLEQRDCYDYFLFSQTVRETPQCQGISRQIENARKRLARLEEQRIAASDETAQRNRQDALIAGARPLALRPAVSAGGEEAQQRRLSASGTIRRASTRVWIPTARRAPATRPTARSASACATATISRSATRLCRTPSAATANACSSQCAAPTELYYYQNPGAEVEQAMSLAGAPYTKLKTAWLYRKELVKGCSCKVAEYADGGGERTPRARRARPRKPCRCPRRR